LVIHALDGAVLMAENVEVLRCGKAARSVEGFDESCIALDAADGLRS
jgi:hypothetical protein